MHVERATGLVEKVLSQHELDEVWKAWSNAVGLLRICYVDSLSGGHMILPVPAWFLDTARHSELPASVRGKQ